MSESIFVEDHQTQYGLRISQRDKVTSAVCSVSCRFCETFGKEEVINEIQRNENNNGDDQQNKKRRGKNQTTKAWVNCMISM